MIPQGVAVYIALEPVDMRLGFERLAGVAREKIGYDARSGALFLFFGKRKTALKVLFFDGTGMCQFYKRLDAGTFRIPEPSTRDATSVSLSEAELDTLLSGIEPARTSTPKIH